MDKEENNPYGIIYIATNSNNGKNYVGKTKKTPEERWQEHLDEAQMLENTRESNPDSKIRGTHLNNAIIKYEDDAFIIKQIDVAYSREELNEKETYYVKEYDSMNPDKGYNMTPGGEGGRPRPEVIERMTEISRERAKDPEWINKMTEINQEIGRNPVTQGKISDSLSGKWQEPQYQENVSKGVTNKWQESEHRQKQFRARREGRREISDKREFLKDIQEMKKKDINTKYDMDGKSINLRIKEMLGHQEVKNYSEAKKYLENKNLDDVLKDINKRLREHPNEFKGKKEISNKREFLEDIQKMQRKDIDHKYDMNRSTVNKRIQEMLGDHGVKNYTEAKKYLEGKNLDEVVKDINERLSDQSHITEGTTIIENKQEFLKDIQELQKNEIDHKYGMDAKTVNNKIKEMLGEKGVNNYTEAKEYLKDKNVEDVAKDIDKQSDEKQSSPSEEPDEEKEEEKPEGLKEEVDKDEKQPEEKSTDQKDRISEESTEQIPEKESEGIKEQVKETSEKLGKGKEFGMKLKPVREKDTHRQGSKESRAKGGGSKTPILTSGIRQKQPVQRGSKDYDGIDRGPSKRWKDYLGIDRNLDSSGDDIKGLGGSKNDKERDYDGIDKPREKKGKDYVKLEDNYGEGRYEG